MKSKLDPKKVIELIAMVSELGACLSLIVAEFESDPMSVQCFDLRLVADAKAAVKKWQEFPV